MVWRVLALLFILSAVLTRVGGTEAVESALHLAVHGHPAHAAATQGDGTDESHGDIEHGCVGDFHVCPCCSHQPVAYWYSSVTVPCAGYIECLLPVEIDRGPDGTVAGIFRPPIRS